MFQPIIFFILVVRRIEASVLKNYELSTFVDGKEFNCQCPCDVREYRNDLEYYCEKERNTISPLSRFCRCLLNSCICIEATYQRLHKRAGGFECFASSSRLVPDEEVKITAKDLTEPDNIAQARNKIIKISQNPEKYMKPKAAVILKSEMLTPAKDITTFPNFDSLDNEEYALFFAAEYLKYSDDLGDGGENLADLAFLIQEEHEEHIFDRIDKGIISLAWNDGMLQAVKD